MLLHFLVTPGDDVVRHFRREPPEVALVMTPVLLVPGEFAPTAATKLGQGLPSDGLGEEVGVGVGKSVESIRQGQASKGSPPGRVHIRGMVVQAPPCVVQRCIYPAFVSASLILHRHPPSLGSV